MPKKIKEKLNLTDEEKANYWSRICLTPGCYNLAFPLSLYCKKCRNTYI